MCLYTLLPTHISILVSILKYLFRTDHGCQKAIYSFVCLYTLLPIHLSILKYLFRTNHGCQKFARNVVDQDSSMLVISHVELATEIKIEL